MLVLNGYRFIEVVNLLIVVSSKEWEEVVMMSRLFYF